MYSPMMMRATDVDVATVRRTPILTWATHAGDPGTTLGAFGRHVPYATPPQLVPRFLSDLGRGGGGGAHSTLRGLGRGGGGGAGAHAALRGFSSHGPVMAQRVHGFGRPYSFLADLGKAGGGRGRGGRGVHGLEHAMTMTGFADLGRSGRGGGRGGRGVHGIGDFTSSTPPGHLGWMVDKGPTQPWFPGLGFLGLGQDLPVDASALDVSAAVVDVTDPSVMAATLTPEVATVVPDPTVDSSGLPDTWGTQAPTDWLTPATTALKFAATAASAVLPYFGVKPTRAPAPPGYAYSSTGQLVRVGTPTVLGGASRVLGGASPLLIVGGLAAVGAIAYFALK